ncbi:MULTISPECIES: site-specific integrase [unclassified Marinobacterium]|uniref:tyrosine-type recombinase/integrase n=1 Tax=unclassified Marinobacterium TaxID=2644139 RepID=UPI001569F5AA|nr:MULTISPECIES: site-specific integrase [unclassified Marinobacterium]NRP53655.1 Tyrosine recombinase XerC [Marinobacterium sp. xm-v-242]NRP78153.1 Tyrosine recombinase XerC [Marinobacterium sp. xm-m-383]
MATIRPIKGKKSTSYRVEAMIAGTRSSKTFKTKSEALRYQAHLTLKSDSIAHQNYNLLQTMSLSELLDEFLCSYKGKDTSLHQRIMWWRSELGHYAVGKISKKLIRDSLKKLQTKGLSNATYNRYKAALSSAFTFADDEYDTQFNPARQVKQLPENKSIDNPLNLDSVEAILKACKKSSWERLYMFVVMALHTGARRSELLGLKWSDINFTNQTAYLSKTKNGDPRILPLNSEVIAELQKYRVVGNSYVFPHPTSPHKPFVNIDKHWYKALKIASVGHYRIHDLRHTTGTWLANANIPITAIQQVMGHKTIQTTQRYIHHDILHKSKVLQSVFRGVS